jgi:hypothetical protein
MLKLPLSIYTKETFTKYNYLHPYLWNEIKVYSFMKQIPDYLQHYYIFNEYEINEKQVKLIYLSHPSQYQLLFYFIFQQKNYIFYIIYSFISILQKLKLLNSHNIYYMNPYPLSYFIKNNTDIYLSNFSYSYLSKKNKFFKKIPFLKNMNNDYPLETHFIYYLTFDWETLDIEKIYFIIHKLSLQIHENEIISFYKQFINQDKKKIIYSLFSYCNTWDIYILSRIFLPIFHSLPTNIFLSEFVSLLTLCSHPIPTYRKSYLFIQNYIDYLSCKYKSFLFF